MSFGLFDVVGPIMHGPSSNHTGGANRIGWVAGKLIGGVSAEYTFMFNPIFMRMFSGHRSHIAMLAGCLGMREYEDGVNDSKKEADKRGIALSYQAIEHEETDRNTMRIKARYDGIDWLISSISIGGGNILVDRINGVATQIDGNCYTYLFILRKGSADQERLAKLKAVAVPLRFYSGSIPEGDLVCLETRRELSEGQLQGLKELIGTELLIERAVEPVTRFGDATGKPPLFTTFAELLELCRSRALIEVVKQYEIDRSGRSEEEVMAQALEIVDVIDASMQRGRRGDNPLLAGFCSGSDGRMVDEWGRSGRSIVGEVFNDALSGALAMAEISASAGRVVAVPTSGSAGGLPGTLFAVAKRFGSSKEALAEAFLVAAAAGAIIGNTCSFSGSIGGCQAEIGIGAGMAAAGACYLAGGSAEVAVEACSMAIKNCLGLVCDPLASPVEVPCIKRNAMGASVALMAAEMALAGVRSAVPADDVVVALKDVQQRLPTELKGACVGGLAAAPIAKELQARWQQKLEKLREMS